MYDKQIIEKRYRNDLSDLTENTGFVCIEYAIRKWKGCFSESSNTNPSPVEQAVGFSTDYNRDYKECTVIVKYPIDKQEEIDMTAREFFIKFEQANGEIVWPDEEGYEKYKQKIFFNKFKFNDNHYEVYINWKPNLKWDVDWHLVPCADVIWNY